MKKMAVMVFIFLALIFISSCTNNEGSEDLDVVMPNDSLQGKVNTMGIPQ